MEGILIGLASWITSLIAKIGYWGVFLLMAIESSFIPFPSEVVIPLAAFLAQQGQMNIYLVILAGIAGSLLGALINYYLALTLGRKIIYTLAGKKFFRFLLITPDKIDKAEKYFLRYGKVSTLIGRLVPWVRQLISVPAGFAKMKLSSFVFYTALGSGIWVIVLAILGYAFGSNHGQFEKYYGMISWIFVILAVVLVAILIIKKRK